MRNMRRNRIGALLSLVMAAALIPFSGAASDGEAGSAGGQHDQHDHSAHMRAAAAAKAGKTSYEKKRADFNPPDVTLVGRDGEEQALIALLDTEKPVMLNFIFTSCTTICPVMTSTFVEVEKQLGSDREQVLMVSISIDPEYDTPARLAEYASARGAGEPWAFLTGDPASIRQTQVAFDAYRGNKMNHVPMTFLRSDPHEPWLRIDGFASASDIMREYRGLTTQ
jgi:protein SCO1/2